MYKCLGLCMLVLGIKCECYNMLHKQLFTDLFIETQINAQNVQCVKWAKTNICIKTLVGYIDK